MVPPRCSATMPTNRAHVQESRNRNPCGAPKNILPGSQVSGSHGAAREPPYCPVRDSARTSRIKKGAKNRNRRVFARLGSRGLSLGHGTEPSQSNASRVGSQGPLFPFDCLIFIT